MTTESGSNFFNVSAENSAVSVALTDGNNLAIFAKCTGAPPGTAGLFAHGCLIIRTDSGTGNQSLYENTGTTAAPVWNLVGAISAGEITLAEGSILVGSATGVATALDAKTNTQVLVGNGTTITSVALSSDVTMTNAGVVTIANSAITDAKVSASAGIAFSKLAALTSANILVGSAANVATSTAVTGDVTISNAGVTAIGAAKVLSSMLAPSTIQYATRDLSAAQVLALRATPLEVVPAVAGSIPEFISAELIYDFGGTAYTITAGGDDLQFRFNNGTGDLVSEVVETTGFLDQGADTVQVVGKASALISTGANANGASIVIHNIGANELTLGNGLLRIKVAFRYHVSGL